MQLQAARLCVDCEEVYAAAVCPACASETFVYLSRWVPSEKPETGAQAARHAASQPVRIKRLVFGTGLLGLAAYALTRWARRAHTQFEASALRHAGELR
jgi:hypothetical protein